MISIIIPTYNEEKSIDELISHLLATKNGQKVEILVVDGGSTDQTKKIAKNAGARVVISPDKGRASQMNYGAQKASADILYFLHADTFPPVGYANNISKKIIDGFDCGCFRLKFNDPHPVLSFYAWFTRFNIDVFRFGDQSLFVKKALFQKVGGFDEELLVMEDQEIVTRLKNRAQFCIIKREVVTSARKYQRFGVFKLQLIFAIIVFLFYLKISQEVLAHFYKTFMSGEQH
ncbi:MAG: TIGR04283 family arsenosugar biosynthesis glycosyltransferase [Gracilimonas sp.]|nr:TIGR04283 family arsenosugar biosynthesis glycosyltransferase [Gracilimonas sp.]